MVGAGQAADAQRQAPGPARAPGGQARAAAANPDLDPGSTLGSALAPDFRLVNQFGQPMSLRQFRGKVVILAFTDSQCTTVCPLTTASMPSPDAARSYLRQLGRPLGYPVVLDPAGRLADGYGVRDQPWFVLTSAPGKIMWTHHGWLPVSTLKAAARRAAAPAG